MTLKRSHRLQLSHYNHIPVLQSRHSKFYQEKDIKRLFQHPYRQVFQLSYLYASPLCKSYPAFAEIVKMLENFNEDAIAVEGSQPRNQNLLKNLCVRFIYREMLSIAVMNQNEIMKNDYATKLKNWFYNLTERHSFLQGINFKKKKSEEEKLEQLIRQSYVSNVFDEIDDYMRKRFMFEESAFQKENYLSEKRKGADESHAINLPLIDIQLYKRQGQFLRNYREREIESKYFHDVRTNKNKMREISLNNIKNRQFANNIAKTDYAKTDHKMASTNMASTFHSNFNDLKNERITKSSKSLISNMDMSDHIDWRRKPSQIQDMIQEKREKNKLTLININGINLIRSKYE